MHKQISSGTYDSPNWDIVRCAKLAARVYAPLGTRMALGDHVRVCRAFVEAFKWAEAEGRIEGMSVTTSGSEEEDEDSEDIEDEGGQTMEIDNGTFRAPK